MKKQFTIFVLAFFTCISAWALTNDTGLTTSGLTQTRLPLSGILTIMTGGDYATFTAAINDLNANGVGVGGVTFNVTGNFIENPPAITASGAADSPIIFQNSGALHGKLYASGTTGTSDFGFCINGGDYITFNGIDVYIYSGYLVEFGFYIKNNGTDGSTHNTVQNSVIQLTQQNANTKAIYVFNNNAATTAANSYNHFYNLDIKYAISGIYMVGSTAVGSEDLYNEVGILPAGTSSIMYMGGSSAASYGVYLSYQQHCRISNLAITNVSSTTSSNGIFEAGARNDVEISNNILTTISASTAANGISVAGNSHNIFNNEVNGVSSTTNYAIGINMASGTNNIYKNKVHAISVSATTTAAYGISLSGGTNYFYNNIVYDIRATGSSNTPATSGIYVYGGMDYIYYNTVVLTGTTTVANSSSAAVYQGSVASVIDMKNNIFVNNSATGAGATGIAAALWRATTNFTNMVNTTDNNLYYAGAPGLQHLIFNNGTNKMQTLADYKALVSPRDNFSVTENPPFVSVSNLHIQTLVPTQIEGAGQPITTPLPVLDDFDNDVRSASYPDIGADEGGFTASDQTAPNILGTLLGNSSSLTNRILTNITITDFSGVDTSPGNAPRIYYKKSTDANAFGANNSSANGWKWTETLQTASPYSFTLDYTLLQSTPVAGDVIQYFVTAQDLGTPTAGSLPSLGFVGSSVGTITSAPTNPASYQILYVLSGIKTVGIAGDFPTITAACSYYNYSDIVGPTEFHLLDTTYPSETFPLVLNEIPGLSAANTVLIKPALGVTGILVTGSSTSSIFNLNNADYITINGSNNGTTSRDLSIYNGSTGGSGVLMNGNASHNSLLNCIVMGSGTVANSAGVNISTSATGNDNLVSNCLVHEGSGRPYIGIYLGGQFTGAATIQGCTVYNTGYYGIWMDNAASHGNIIENNAVYDFTNNGICVQTGINATVSNNEIYMTANALSGFITALYVYNAPGILVTSNHIHDIRGTTSALIYGIAVNSPGLPVDVSVINNEVYLETAITSTTSTVYGIAYNGGMMINANFYYNTVLIGGTSNGGANTYAFAKLAAGGILRIKDNIFVNNRTTGTGVSKNYAIGFLNTSAVSLEIDYNDYFASGVNGYLGLTVSTNISTLADWQIATTQDANSANADPDFSFGVQYLKPNSTSPISSAGIPIAGITLDIAGITRNTTAPTPGAYDISTAPQIPGSPLNVFVIQSGTDNIINWDIVSGVSSYNVYGSVNPYNAGTWDLIGNVSVNTFTDTVYNAVPRYFYRVTSVAP